MTSGMERLQVGYTGEALAVVSEMMTAAYMGSGSLPVYATPALVALLESAAVSAVDPYLDNGFATVGIEIHVEHVSATPIGERVTATAEVKEIQGRRVMLEVRAWDERELIGEGLHVRYVIDTKRFLQQFGITEQDMPPANRDDFPPDDSQSDMDFEPLGDDET